jgi:hypothetical protein
VRWEQCRDASQCGGKDGSGVFFFFDLKVGVVLCSLDKGRRYEGRLAELINVSSCGRGQMQIDGVRLDLLCWEV